jgi:lipoate-protein ligase B
VKIAQVEGVMESYREEVDYMKKFCQKLDSNKTDNIAFNDHVELFTESTRKMRVSHDTLVDRTTNIENF